MFCTRCGSEYSQKVQFCSNCGSPLETSPGSSIASDVIDQLFDYGPWDVAQLPFEEQPTLVTYLPNQPTPLSEPVPPAQLFPEIKNMQSPQQAPSTLKSNRVSVQAEASFPFDEATWLMPIPHSPFSDVPLPQPSEQLPMLFQSSGEIVALTPDTYTPRSTEKERNLADFPTNIQNPLSLDSLSNQPTANMPLSDVSAFPHQPESATPLKARNANDQPTKPLAQQFLPAMQDMEIQAGTIYPYTARNGNYTDSPQQPLSRTRGEQRPLSPEYTYALLSESSTKVSLPSNTLLDRATSKLIRPLPIWVLLLLMAIGALLLGAIVFLNSDWATGSVIAGVVALILAVLLLIITGVRVALGMLIATNSRRRLQAMSATLIVLILFLFSGISITQQSGLHAAQARYLEGQQHWQIALNEYKAAGETAPASVNLARIYNEWGEDLSTHNQYSEAVEKFSTVLKDYNPVTTQVNRSKTDLVRTYTDWGQFDSQHQDFANATAHYDTLLSLNYCDSTCNTLIQSADATAYYQLAEQQLKAQQFALASNAFRTLTTNFAGSSQARQVHTDYAKALWELGQQQLKNTCQDAVKTYEQLTRQFADTVQGKSAIKALQQPVSVKGRFTTTLPPAPNTPTVALVQGLFVGIQQYQFPALLKNASSASINHDGSFLLTNIAQGTYELIWSNDGSFHYFYASNGDTVLYTATPGPLCTYNFGNINETIPSTT